MSKAMCCVLLSLLIWLRRLLMQFCEPLLDDIRHNGQRFMPTAVGKTAKNNVE